MMTRMIRTCVLPAKLKNVGILTLLGAEEAESNEPVIFDAFRFEYLKYERSASCDPEEHYLVKIYLTNPYSVILRYFPKENINVLMRQTRYLIQEALNAPVQVTQEVLDAMNKVPEAKFSLVEKTINNRSNVSPLYWEKQDKFWFSLTGEWGLELGSYIQADCLLALEVLLDFYKDGTPVSKGGSND